MLRQRTTVPLIIRASAPRLGGAVKAPDVSTMQFIIRTGQTRAFGNVVVVGALLSGLCGIAVPHVVHGMAQDRVHGPAPSIGAHRLKSGAPVTTGAELNSSGDPAPPNYAEQAAIFETLTPRATTAADATEPSADVTGNYLDLATALDEFEQDEARKEAWAVQNGLPSLPVCGPTCTAPGPGQLPAVFVPPRDPMSVDHLPSQATVQTPPEQLHPSPAVADAEPHNQVETPAPGDSPPTATSQGVPPDGLVPAPAGDAQDSVG